MNIMPDVVPVSHLRTHHRELFHQLEEGPVILVQRSKPAAVLVSVAEWNAKNLSEKEKLSVDKVV